MAGLSLVQGEGFEPPNSERADLQSAVFDRFTNPAIVPLRVLEPPVGFEPTTLGLQNRCSNQLS